jgi:hypothetical protein
LGKRHELACGVDSWNSPAFSEKATNQKTVSKNIFSDWMILEKSYENRA